MDTYERLKKMLIEDLTKPCNKDLVLVVGGVRFDSDWALRRYLEGGIKMEDKCNCEDHWSLNEDSECICDICNKEL